MAGHTLRPGASVAETVKACGGTLPPSAVRYLGAGIRTALKVVRDAAFAIAI